ncbi:hypothetical protein [Sinobacterium caligoides]|uniref:hypothetical protein n=1 Tax=Sinobacterium caligoides TaxID=933926 RepID=UPI0013C31D9E|nr:hypothetical protein [Sinobacterium caligoides]
MIKLAGSARTDSATALSMSSHSPLHIHKHLRFASIIGLPIMLWTIARRLSIGMISRMIEHDATQASIPNSQPITDMANAIAQSEDEFTLGP